MDADLYVNNLKIKGVRVENGKVTLTQTDLKNATLVDADVEGYTTARMFLLDEDGKQVDTIPKEPDTYEYTVLITTSDNLSVEIPVEVTVKAASTEAKLDSLFVKGVEVDLTKLTGDGTKEAKYQITVSGITSAANADEYQVAIDVSNNGTWAVSDDNEDAGVVTKGNDAEKSKAALKNNGSFDIIVTPEDTEAAKVWYTVKLENVATYQGVVGDVFYVDGNNHADVSLEKDDVFDESKGLTFTVTAESGYTLR